MTARELQIIKAILDVAHEAEGKQFPETVLHTATNVRLQSLAQVSATLGEFNACLDLVGQRGWMTRVISPTTGWKKWNLNDAGEAARQDL